MKISIILLLSLIAMCTIVEAQENPIELGKVNWLRNYDEAIKASQETNKPIFLLFQEIPGCSNCTQYGSGILSHPLIVEAIETEFIPLAIHNNKGGYDKKILKRFGEPAWNNPVVRLIDEGGGDIVQRIANFRSTHLLLSSMIKGVKANGKKVPEYLSVLEKEYRANEGNTEEAYLSMYCFWTGEKEIAQLEGVVATEAGYMHGKEVVKVKYDKDVINLETLSTKANKVGCGDQVFANSKEKVVNKKIGKYRKDKEDKYYLLHSPLQYIPMTELQKSLVNSALGQRKDPTVYLSPRQLELIENQKYKESQIGESISRE